MNKWIAIPIISILIVVALVQWVFYDDATYKLKDAQARIASLETDVSTLQTDLQTELSDSKTTVSTLEIELAAAEAGVSALEAEITSLKSYVLALEAGLAPVTFPDANLEAVIRKLDNTIGCRTFCSRVSRIIRLALTENQRKHNY